MRFLLHFSVYLFVAPNGPGIPFLADSLNIPSKMSLFFGTERYLVFPNVANSDLCKVTRACDTGYPFQVRFAYVLSRLLLLLTCDGCAEIEDSSFVPFGTVEDLEMELVASP